MDISKLQPWEADCFQRGIEDYEKGKLRSQCPFFDWREKFWIEGWQKARYHYIRKTESFRKRKLQNAYDSARTYNENREARAKDEADRKVHNQIKSHIKGAKCKKRTTGDLVYQVGVSWRLKAPGEGRGVKVRRDKDNLQRETPSGKAKVGAMHSVRQDFREWRTGPPIKKGDSE